MKAVVRAKAGMIELAGDWFAVDRITHLRVFHNGLCRVVLDGCEYSSVESGTTPAAVLSAMDRARRQVRR